MLLKQELVSMCLINNWILAQPSLQKLSYEISGRGDWVPLCQVTVVIVVITAKLLYWFWDKIQIDKNLVCLFEQVPRSYIIMICRLHRFWRVKSNFLFDFFINNNCYLFTHRSTLLFCNIFAWILYLIAGNK